MTGDVHVLLAHGDDGLGIERAIAEFGASLGEIDRTQLVPERSPDQAVLDRARIESASVGLFGPHLVVLHQPLLAAGRSGTAAEKLLGIVRDLPAGGALALAEERPSREMPKPPALLRRLEEAVRDRGGQVLTRQAPRRAELAAWTQRHASALRTSIDARAAALLAERVGGMAWETDIERGEQTRIIDSELRKLATRAGERPIGVADVEELTADVRPASVFAITNAIDRREPAAAAAALDRALAEGQPVLRILASIHARVSDLLVADDLLRRGASTIELIRAVGRGNARMSERLVEAARRYRREELEGMLEGLFEVDLAIKSNELDPDSAITAWLGEQILGSRRATGARGR